MQHGMGGRSRHARQHLGAVEAALSEARYFAGETFTAADVMMAYPFTTFRTIDPLDLAPYPAIGAYMRRLGARPAFQRATRPAGS